MEDGEKESPGLTAELTARIENSFGPLVEMKIQKGGEDAPDVWHLAVTYGGVNYGQDGPVYENARLPLKSADVERIFRRLREARLPARIAGVWGLDGTSYSLETGEGSNHARFKWWQDVPAGWEPLSEVIEILKTYLPAGIDHGSR